MTDRFERSVVVTGAARGIGHAIALRLAADGWAVIALDVYPREDAHPPGIDLIAGDVTRIADLERAASAAELRAPLRGWVNNAMTPAAGLLHELEEAEILATLDVNLIGAIRGTAVATRTMIRSATVGAIVNVSSLQSTQPVPGSAPYAVAKAGLDGLTRATAVDYASVGIRANAVAPGAIATDAFVEGLRAMSFDDAGIHQAEVSARHPRGQLGSPEEVASVVAFLLSDDAANVTGVIVPVDGGRAVYQAGP